MERCLTAALAESFLRQGSAVVISKECSIPGGIISEDEQLPAGVQIGSMSPFG